MQPKTPHLTPKLRRESQSDLQSRIYLALWKELEAVHVYKNCLLCCNFREQTEICSLANQRPPARVIIEGCKMFEDKDEIPF